MFILDCIVFGIRCRHI